MDKLNYHTTYDLLRELYPVQWDKPTISSILPLPLWTHVCLSFNS